MSIWHIKVGQIQKLVADADEELGKTLAPYVAIHQVVFLITFVAYFVVALVALVLDADAMDTVCATDTWIWLYVQLVIPTTVGFIVGLLQATSRMATQDEAALRMVDIFLAFPSPVTMVVLGVIGLALWGGMEDACADFYGEIFGLLLVVLYSDLPDVRECFVWLTHVVYHGHLSRQ